MELAAVRAAVSAARDLGRLRSAWCTCGRGRGGGTRELTPLGIRHGRQRAEARREEATQGRRPASQSAGPIALISHPSFLHELVQHCCCQGPFRDGQKDLPCPIPPKTSPLPRLRLCTRTHCRPLMAPPPPRRQHVVTHGDHCIFLFLAYKQSLGPTRDASRWMSTSSSLSSSRLTSVSSLPISASAAVKSRVSRYSVASLGDRWWWGGICRKGVSKQLAEVPEGRGQKVELCS